VSTLWSQYYQVSADGTGGVVVDTEWLSREEFRKLELEFRDWINARPVRGSLQNYERKIYQEGRKDVVGGKYDGGFKWIVGQIRR